jgi:tetratricopeptide (TPR) repeat protein
MYNNVGKLIGYYRKKMYDKTKLTNFSQVGFVFYGDRMICAQSKLSIIENGKIRIPYPDEYDYLIKNLGYTSTDYKNVDTLYSDYITKIFDALQYQPEIALLDLLEIYNQQLKEFNDIFYLHELNFVIKATINAHLGVSLPNLEFLDNYLDALECFPNEVQFLILDLANLIVENYIPYKEVRDKVNGLVDHLHLDAPIVQILKASRNLRQLKMIDVQQKIKSIKTESLNNLMKFRIQRMLFMIEIESVDQLANRSELLNPAVEYEDINRFERCRPYVISGYLHYSFQNYEVALKEYKNAQAINPEAVCFSLIYISDCLYELHRMDDLRPYLIEAEKHIRNFSALHYEVDGFFNIITGMQKQDDESIQFRPLFKSLSQLNSDSPYVRIIRKHLLNYAKRTHKYKLIFDYELMMLDNH